MGVYLNSKKPFSLFFDEAAAPYFVDKSEILNLLIPLVEQSESMIGQGGMDKRKGNKYICITRPRRFGKTLIASMIASFFSRGRESLSVFKTLKIGKSDRLSAHLNQHNVFYITLNEVPDECTTYAQYISRIKRNIRADLRRAFPGMEAGDNDAVWDILNYIYESEEDARFIFVLDEWDYIFHRDFVTSEEKKAYIEFLSNLLKGQPYVEMAYMTGILPIEKYSSGSELNMFYEYTMATEELYSEYFGFTEDETDDLYERYLSRQIEHKVSREGLRTWYDGYHTRSGERMYNPRSVVAALTNNNLGNYWTSSGPYDEIFYYIEKNIADVRDDLAFMVSGMSVPAKVREYAATSMNLTTRDEIFSAMVVYGFLNYEEGRVSIPNQELMDKFADMIKKEASLGYVHRLAIESDRMLRATKSGDTETMLEILEYAHNTEVPLLSYNHEADLTAVVNLVYLSARDSYYVEREDKAGIGYVDFIFYPKTNYRDDAIILELKVDHTAEEAVQQIKDKKYMMKLEGKLGEGPQYIGRILAVGIAYDKNTKKHSCKIEVLRKAIR